MAVFRIEKNKNYTVMSNYHLRDNRLSLKAKGLLSVMLSLPDDWNYSLQGLVSICKENETAVKTALRELQQAEYLVINKHMPNTTESGRIEYEYVIYEQPCNKEQEDEKQDIEFLPLENQGQLNTNKTNTNNKKLYNNKLLYTTKSGDSRYTLCIQCIDDFCTKHNYNSDIRNLLIQYLNYRLEVRDKPLYKNMWKGMLGKLALILEDTQQNIETVIRQSLERGYLTFYPVNNAPIKKSSNIHWQDTYELDEDAYKSTNEKF